MTKLIELLLNSPLGINPIDLYSCLIPYDFLELLFNKEIKVKRFALENKIKENLKDKKII